MLCECYYKVIYVVLIYIMFVYGGRLILFLDLVGLL